MPTIYLYSLDSKETIAATEGWFASGEPAFSADGKFLFFVSNRTFNPTYGQTEFNYSYSDMAKIYLLTLSKETKSPFEPKSDEVKIKEEAKEPAESSNGNSDKKAKPEPVVVKVDADGLPQRIAEFPVPGASYRHLVSVGNKLHYMIRKSEERSKLAVFDLDARKHTELGEADGYEISADDKKILIGRNSSYFIVDLPSAKLSLSQSLNLSNMKFRVNRTEEWT